MSLTHQEHVLRNGPFTPGLHTYSVYSVYAVHVRYVSGAEAAQTAL